MKRILLVSDEKTPQDNGLIADSAKYGLADGLYNIPNLRAALARQGDFEIVTCHHTELLGAPERDYTVLSGRFQARVLAELDEEYRVLFDFIRANETPMLGVCAGVQLISHAFGSTIRTMDDPDGEFGFTCMTVCTQHPMLKGLEDGFTCMEMHRDIVCSVPDGFTLLASTEKCPVQMIAHNDRPIVGMQFHPELQDKTHRDGEILLQNFFKLY